MVKAKILNPDAIEVEVTMCRTIADWKIIRDRLKMGTNRNYHATSHVFEADLTDIVAAIEKTIEPEASEN